MSKVKGFMDATLRMILFVCVFLGIFQIHKSFGADDFPIDIKEAKCMEKDYTTSGMANCTYAALSEWEKEVVKYNKLLVSLLNDKDRKIANDAQSKWVIFKDAEFKNASAVYGNLKGTMYINVLANVQAGIVKQRALDLRNYYELLRDGERWEWSK